MAKIGNPVVRYAQTAFWATEIIQLFPQSWFLIRVFGSVVALWAKVNYWFDSRKESREVCLLGQMPLLLFIFGNRSLREAGEGMAIEFGDVLKADLVLVGFPLLDRPGEIEAFRAEYKEARISGGGVNIDVQSNKAEQGQVVTLDRDRITLELFPSRAVIRREYPTDEVDLTRLAEVAYHAISITAIRGKMLRAYGFNLDLIYDQDSGRPAYGYLADRLLSGGLQQMNEWQLSGAATRVTYFSGEDQWQIAIEPRFGDPLTNTVFLNVNLHISASQLPDLDAINDSLKQVWKWAHDFANFLDLQEVNICA